jgi:hypothetical protein
MSVQKPTTEELAYWENILNPGRDTINAQPRTFYSHTLPETLDKLPAKPVSSGGLLWKERIFVNHKKQDRKRRQRIQHQCPCGKEFVGTQRGTYCSRRCIDRFGKRRRRSKSVPQKLPISSEGREQ